MFVPKPLRPLRAATISVGLFVLAAAFALASLASGVAWASDLPAQNELPSRPFPHAPAWIADQTLYEVNLRQFSPEGTVEGLRKQLPRLKELRVGTLWIMPINPIGSTNRPGKLGSPYAVKNYTQFNPEFGTLDDFKA